MPASTILTIAAIGLPPYSARGLKQTLSPINGATQLRRTVNGALADVADPLFRKYESTITGDDVDPPALGVTWPGALLTVGCISELAVLGSMADTDPPTLGRTPVSGSVREADGFVFFRPQLTMRVIEWTSNTDEWAAATSWSLRLEEV